MMPGESGLALTKKLRKNISTPIILLTAKGEVDDRIIGLESGADDYLVKPFSPKELLLRINNILKKTKEETLEEKIKIGENLLNLKKMIIEKNGKTIKINGT
jgi:two-component system phosphate regulon response regulator OmpR